jgi:uncharacterized protein
MRTPWRVLLPIIALALLIAGRVALGWWAEISVKSGFYDALGMGAAYDRRWHVTAVLVGIALAIALVFALPLLLLVLRATRAQEDPDEVSERSTVMSLPGLDWEWAADIERRFGLRRRIPGLPRAPLVLAWTGVVALLFAANTTVLVRGRDTFLAALERVPFGVDDPIFGRDVSFHVFAVPALERVVLLLAQSSLLALLATGAAAVGFAVALPARRLVIASLAETSMLLLSGVLALSLALSIWVSRFTMLTGRGETIAGAGRAEATVAIPARGAAAVLTALIAVVLLALAIPPLRRRINIPIVVAGWTVLALWGIACLYLVFASTFWWLVPAVLIAVAAPIWAGAVGEHARRPAPTWVWPVAAIATAVAGGIAGQAGSLLYDAIALRGTTLQVERPYIEHTVEMTRRASGIDQAEDQTATYRRDGVTNEAIARAPASIAALRFLDLDATLSAATRLEAENQFYEFNDADVDRYLIDGQRRTVFSLAREVDYTRVPDFQRRHLSFTHGYGIVFAPVNEIDQSGRPNFVARGIPQQGIEIERPEIYVGASPQTPWALLNTSQPQFLAGRLESRRWEGTTGLRIGSRRLALTVFLGGVPFLGGGRSFWNSTDGDPAGGDAQVLLYRDILARARELAPFLKFDRDPYVTVADGKLHVVANAYVTSTRYPYSATFRGRNYQRGPAIVDIEAYSGETRIYVLDPDEPMLRTWRKVYPSLFTPLDQMPRSLREHLRYGEDLFDYQSTVIERFHVSDVDRFYNQDESWAPTTEATGRGVSGTRADSPARYTYAVMPGETTERFVVIRSYKPRISGRGIGFSGWLAVDNEPDSFGRMRILEFARDATLDPLDSLDTFSANVSRDPNLSAQIGVRRDQVLRGGTIVVPIGKGLLYTQPLYLDSPGDSLPTLWQVIVSFGDGRVYSAPTFRAALGAAFAGRGDGGNESGEGPGVDTVQAQLDAAADAVAAAEEALVRAREALERARGIDSGNATTPEATTTTGG